MGAVAVRYWWTRNLALQRRRSRSRAAAGATGAQALDTYLGVGPIVGLTLLLGNWRHLAVAASPELALVWFKPERRADSGSTTMLALRAALEARAALRASSACRRCRSACSRACGFQYESVRGHPRSGRSACIGGDSVWGALSNLFVRYYL